MRRDLETDVLRGGVVLIGWMYAAWMVGAVIGAKAGGRIAGQRAMVLTLGWSARSRPDLWSPLSARAGP
jgi:hypothetical protein